MIKISRAFDYIKRGIFFHRLWLHFFITRKMFKIYDLFSWADKVDSHKIVMCNFTGGGYGGECHYIADYIIKHNLNFKIVWLADENLCSLDFFPKNIKLVKYASFSAMRELSTAGIWIDNCRKMFYPRKKKNQFYIQTWHGTFAIKKIEKDANMPESYNKMAQTDSNMMNLLISGCRQKTNIYKKCFWYQGEILECGTPACDVFFDNDRILAIRNKLKKLYKIENDTHIILYAPSFRDSVNLDIYNIDYENVLKAVIQRFGGNWQFMVRLHPDIREKADELCVPKYVINVTKYPDVQELLCLTDVCITDLSGLAFQYIFRNKPVFLYFPDITEYLQTNRGMYITPEQTPFSLSKNNDDLCKKIIDFDDKKYQQKLKDFKSLNGFCETGHSCEKIMDVIQDFVNKNSQ